MFITLNSFKAEENWEDIFLRGNWEEIDCSAVAEKQSVTAGYAEKQVLVSTFPKHTDMTIRLFADGDLLVFGPIVLSIYMCKQLLNNMRFMLYIVISNCSVYCC